MSTNFFTSFLFLLLSNVFYGQVVFEKGYIINNNDDKIDCLIKNLDWLDNPQSFVYKLTEDSNEVVARIDDVKEFGILNHSKYIRVDVDIDRSSNVLGSLSQNRNPEFVNERLYLKVVIEGKANLYSYLSNNLSRFFYNLDGGEIKQLVYKQFEYSASVAGKNENYKQELWTNLVCDDIKLSYIESLRYTLDVLSKFFIKYNDCQSAPYISYLEFKDPILFLFKAKVGLRKLNYNYSSKVPNVTIKDDMLSYRFGLEAEFLLPVNKYKWAIFLEPSFTSISDNGDFDMNNGSILQYEFNYTQIEMPIGIRYYMFLNSKENKLFFNVYYLADFGFFDSKNRIEVSNNDTYSVTTTDLTKRSGLGFGMGYDYHKKFQVELRHNLKKSHSLYSSRVFDVSSIELVLGYTFL